MAGALVLVVGPSGAGKDTLIAAARDRLAGDARFVFVRRLVTREAVVELEDSISRADFDEGRRTGRFALSWDAHGLGYGLPGSMDGEMRAGRIVVANGSRQVIPDARLRYPGCRIVLIDAPIGIRAARLAGRGRETAAEIAARLAREVDTLHAGDAITRIDNSGPVGHGVAALVAVLESLAG